MKGRRHRRLLVAIVCLAACRGQGQPSSEPIQPGREPLQLALDARGVHDDAVHDRDGAHFTPVAHYRIDARVLSRERYYWGWEADAAPIDFALGWGAMSDPSVDKWIDWHQGGRWYFWQWSADSPFDNAAIRSESANVHIVPGTKSLRRALLSVARGDVIRLQGWLVNIAGPGGETRTTSLTRDDVGSNSCEILYVTELLEEGRVYR